MYFNPPPHYRCPVRVVVSFYPSRGAPAHIILITLFVLAGQAKDCSEDMAASSRQKLVHSTYLCITIALLLVSFCPPTEAVTEEPISACISNSSTLAVTASCKCYRGGRGGTDGRSCGQSNAEFYDLVCSGVSVVDLPAEDVYSHITCLWVWLVVCLSVGNNDACRAWQTNDSSCIVFFYD